MAGGDIIVMSKKELKGAHIMRQVMEGTMRQVEAAEVLGLTERQVRRIIKRIKEEGDKGICHRGRGRPSNRRIAGGIKDKVIQSCQERYRGFGPTLASEKLQEVEGIEISDETLRLWLRGAGLSYRTRKRRPHRRWRERKGRFGEMIQMDGSHHDWLEGRGPECVLMGSIDDATGEVFGRFYEYEGTIPAMDSFKRYIGQYGIPHSVYLDKHTTYKSTAKPTIEDELQGRVPRSQFGRALEELGVEVIHAHSPQAKGRIERLFGTFQDRLVKEMRLLEISTLEEANKFIESYLPAYNKQFRVRAAQEGDLHRPLSDRMDLDKILCIKTKRGVRNDSTIAHDGKLYQIKETIRARSVIVEEKVDGTMAITDQDRGLKYTEITQRPVRESEPVRLSVSLVKRKKSKPAADHIWNSWNAKLFRKGKGPTAGP